MPIIDHQVDDGVFDAIDAGLFILDEKQRIVRWNQWMTSATGIAADAAIGRELQQVFPDVIVDRLVSAVRDAVDFGVSRILTHSLNPNLLPLRTRDGRAMIHNIAIRKIACPTARALIQVTDVTVATDRDRVLRERQNARYDAVVEGAPDAILTMSSDAVIQMANPAAELQFGYLPSDLTGLRISALLNDEAAWASVWDAVMHGPPLTRPVELTGRRKDGSATFLEVSASAWASDNRSFITAIFRDVNERRSAEDALRQLNQTLEQRVAERTADRDRMWRLSTDIMLVARMDGTISSANPAWQSQFGWDEASLIGRHWADFIVPEDRAVLRASLEELAATQAPLLFEVRLQDRGGDSHQIAWNAVIDGDLLQAVGRDVTAERQAQSALAQAEDALRQSQKMEAIGQLTGGIAHDFNNLLTGILGAMDVIKRRMKSGRLEDIDRFMDAASSSAHRAAALTHRLLAFARRQPLNPVPVDLSALVLGMEDLLRGSVGERVNLELDLADGLWPAVTDANQLENALLNLVINARDAMPDGGIVRIATATAGLKDRETAFRNQDVSRHYIVISVTDDGIGMSPDIVAKVFDPFFTTKPIGQGTGLGLSMVYGFAQQSQGHIEIDSAVAKGTTVRLYLPSHDESEVPLTAPVAEQPEAKRTGETVLLVEDEPSVRLLVAEVLRDLGYSLIEAVDAETAIPILASKTPLDLMITDVGLPGLNGRQLAEIGRQHRPDLKVLFVTGYAQHATQRSDFLLPGMKMVTKPFGLDSVAATIRDMIETP